MLAWLNLKRHNFLRLNFKFHGANPFVKTSAAEAAARAVNFKISYRLLARKFNKICFRLRREIRVLLIIYLNSSTIHNF